MKPTKKDIKKWVQALRSGKYKQTTYALQNSRGHCCLGVACSIFIPKGRLHTYNELITGTSLDDQDAPKWLYNTYGDFLSKTGFSFIGLNDGGFTFDEIADLLELVYIHEAL